jgi:hypothetical protein
MDSAAWVRGVWGEPSTATREKGEQIIKTAVDALVKILRDYYSGEIEKNLIRGGAIFDGFPKAGRR